MAIWVRLADAPWRSMCQAACMQSSLVASISILVSAIMSWIICLSARSEPWADRDSARSHIMSKARRAWPIQRMA